MTYRDARWTMADGLPIPSADAALVRNEQECGTKPAPAFVLPGTPAMFYARMFQNGTFVC